MKKNNIILLLATVVTLTTPYVIAEMQEDYLQPCDNNSRDSGWQLLITNKTPQTVTGAVHLVLASYDAEPVEFEIPPGDQFIMSSCKVENRMGPVSMAASKVGGKLLGKVLTAGAKALDIPLPPGMTEKIAEGIMKTQGWYPVCYKRIQFDYETTMGGNAFSRRPASKDKYTYYYSFGNLGAGIACYNMQITLEEANGELKMRIGDDPKAWKDKQRWKSATER